MSSSNPAPGFSNHPNHHIDIMKSNLNLEVIVNGERIAQTREALVLKEKSYADAYYLPKSSLPKNMLHPSNHTTYCPFKGNASYYTLIHNGQVYENAVWYYPAPYDEALMIKDYVAIYPDVAKVIPTAE